MNEFTKALIATEKSHKIPDEYNYFELMIGEWDFEWVDNGGTDAVERHVQGEWIFSWILEGLAVQDVFICPSRQARIKDKQPDAAYGTTVRMFNPNTKTWDILYTELGAATRLEAKKEDDRSYWQ